MNKDHEVSHVTIATPQSELDRLATVTDDSKPRMAAIGKHFQRKEKSSEKRERCPETGVVLEERRPGSPASGWRRLRWAEQRYRPTTEVLTHGVSIWRRGDIFAISECVTTTAPDRTGDLVPQWIVSFSVHSTARRPSDVEVKQALASFGISEAEEDNHESGVARKFWLPVNPKRRGFCECKETERTIVEPDGYTYQTPLDDTKCNGCEVEVHLEANGIHRPCALHGTVKGLLPGPDDRSDAVAYGLGHWNPAPTVEEIRKDLATMLAIDESPEPSRSSELLVATDGVEMHVLAERLAHLERVEPHLVNEVLGGSPPTFEEMNPPAGEDCLFCDFGCERCSPKTDAKKPG